MSGGEPVRGPTLMLALCLAAIAVIGVTLCALHWPE
ncbi:hypothetical protein M2302_000281 [Micromonospora sp. A200]|nr:hypothetical protein [Micromonospora sp. A200]